MTEPASDLAGCRCNIASPWCHPWRRAYYCGLTMNELRERNERLRLTTDVAEEIG